MKKVILGLLAAAVMVMAQTPVASVAPVTASVVQPRFVAVGFAFDGSTGNAWGTYGEPLGSGFYSVTSVDVTVASRQPLVFQHSVRTGVAYQVRQIGSFRVIGLSDAGAAATANSLGSAFSGGGYVMYDGGKKLKSLQFIGGGRFLKTTNGTGTIVEVGIGHTF